MTTELPLPGGRRRVTRLLTDTAAVTVMGATRRASTSLSLFFVARLMGPREVGVLGLAITMATVGQSLSQLGLDQLLARDVPRCRRLAGDRVADSLAIRLASGLVATVLLGLAVWWPLGYRGQLRSIVLLLLLTVVPDSADRIWQSLSVALGHPQVFAVSSALAGALKLTLVALALGRPGGLPLAAAVAVVTSYAQVAVDTFLGIRLVGNHLPAPSLGRIRDLLPSAWPFLWVDVCVVVHSQVDTILLSLQLSEVELGLYRAPLTLATAALIPLEAYRVALLPRLSLLYHRSKPEFVRVFRRANSRLLGLAIGLLVLGSLLGGAALRFVFGDEFSAGAPVLRMLTVALSLGILLVPSARVLIVLGRQDIAARAQVVATAVSLIAMVVLVPHWGPSGAAAARVVAALVLLAICWVRARSLVAPSGLSPSE